MAMHLIRMIARDPKDKSKSQRTMRSYLCNQQEADNLQPKLEAVGMVVTRTPETVGE